ncbi:hypothetical protein [Bradyrhizobium sp.]|uniref:hypothetical protein n=1 Tax=Bradyrhizobium sp. TaxID=376 RepID=UPI003C656F62
MISRTTNYSAMVLAAGFSLGVALPAFAQTAQPRDLLWESLQAQDQQQTEQQGPDASKDQDASKDPDASKDVSAPTDAAAADADDPDMKDIDVSKLDWSQLKVDPSTLPSGLAAKARSAPDALASTPGSDLAWSANDKPNGVSNVSVKQAVSPFLDTRVGADMTVTHEPTTMSELLAEKSANGGSLPQSGGTAWAAVTAAGAGEVWDKTAVEARVDPNTEQSKLGTTLSKQVPLDQQYSVTLQNGLNMTQQGIVPVPGVVARPTRAYATDQSAQFSVSDTGTSITAGQTLSSSEDKWLRKVGAEQKLFDGVSVSGSVAETSQGTTSKSITAEFKKSW